MPTMHELAWLLIGLGLGAAAMIPLAIVAARRTERRVRRLEQRAAGAERLAGLGTLTGGLAHEIKNPLSTIGLNLQLIRETLDEADIPEPQRGRLKRRIDSLNSEAQRLRDILEDFLRFAGRMQLEREPTQLNQLVDELVDFYSPQAEQSGVQLRSHADPSDPTLDVDRSLLKQAVLNLLINATQAMVQARYGDTPHGGAADLMVRVESTRDEVKLHVTDTGPGIDDEKLAKIFQPYYSTKKGGTGLGLATSRRIAEEHGGALTVHTEPGKGSDFVITLPRETEESTS